MPRDRIPVSLSQFAELLCLDPARFVGVSVDRRSSTITILQEPEMQTTGTCPPLSDNTIKRKPKGKGKKGR